MNNAAMTYKEECEALRAEVERQAESYNKIIEKCGEELLARKTELESLRKDAARYRWLRDVSVPPHNFYISVPVEFDGIKYSPEEVDSYIDASLKEQVVTLEKLQGVALIESLRAEAAEMREDHMKLVEENHELRQQLAASPLEAKRMREALDWARSGFGQAASGFQSQKHLEEYWSLCNEALSFPTSTEALDTYVAEKVKEISKSIDEFYVKAVGFGEIVEKLTRQRDLAVSALQFAQEKIAELHIEAGDGDCHYPMIDDALVAIKESEV